MNSKTHAFVRPARSELRIREDFGHTVIAHEGQVVRRTAHITRRIKDGDLIEGPLPQPEPAAKKKTSKTEAGE